MKIASIWYRFNVHNSIVVVQFEHCAITKKVEFIYEEKKRCRWMEWRWKQRTEMHQRKLRWIVKWSRQFIWKISASIFLWVSSVERLFFRLQYLMLAFCHFTVKFNSRVRFVPFHLRFAAASYVFYQTCYFSLPTTMLSILYCSRDQPAGRQSKREEEVFWLCMILSIFIPFNSFTISHILKIKWWSTKMPCSS